MPFKRFVQTGRIAYINDGPFKGKLVTIVDVIDQNRVLVDGPQHKVPRAPMRLTDLHLTKFCIKFPYTASTRVVRKAWDTAKLDELWSQTMWAKKVENKKKRLDMSDFDRFKLRKARQMRNKMRTRVFLSLKKKSLKAPKKAGEKAAAEKKAGEKATTEKKAAAPKAPKKIEKKTDKK